jgi:hypothetical protein
MKTENGEERKKYMKGEGHMREKDRNEKRRVENREWDRTEGRKTERLEDERRGIKNDREECKS